MMSDRVRFVIRPIWYPAQYPGDETVLESGTEMAVYWKQTGGKAVLETTYTDGESLVKAVSEFDSHYAAR